ncbi:hypothetical protein VNI00_002673 [Paramarasmius palmivorus]|uniref:UspA domain-containing protein n=1 Tax=Paramarasmius palmivorus TaxID=297713 RepID=A0AAW0E1P7_9AGAR
MSTSPSTSPPMFPHPHPHPSAPRRSALKQPSSAATSPATSPFSLTNPLPDVGGVELTISPTIGSTVSAPPGMLRHQSSETSVGGHVFGHGSSMPQTPVPGYTPKVSFDTFENPAASMFSFTLILNPSLTTQHRVFLCASSPDESGSQALDWALESFVQDGDEFVVFRGIEEDELEKDHDSIREDARELMKYIQGKCQEVDPDRKVSIILEYIAGKVTDTLDRLIALYRPDSVIVGTRGRKLWQMGLKGTMGSVSKYCLTHSPVPIIVVRPERKVKKAMEKRRANPKRGFHFD